jgi:hypothetical protein
LDKIPCLPRLLFRPAAAAGRGVRTMRPDDVLVPREVQRALQQGRL